VAAIRWPGFPVSAKRTDAYIVAADDYAPNFGPDDKLRQRVTTRIVRTLAAIKMSDAMMLSIDDGRDNF
jgi:hypothetical protein